MASKNNQKKSQKRKIEDSSFQTIVKLISRPETKAWLKALRKRAVFCNDRNKSSCGDLCPHPSN